MKYGFIPARIWSLTPAKVVHKLRREAGLLRRRFADSRRLTYAVGYSGRLVIPLETCVPEPLRTHAETLARLSRRYVRHEFDILGSGWKKWAAPGARSGSWGIVLHEAGETAASMSAETMRESERLLGLIDPDYQRMPWRTDLNAGYTWPRGQHYSLVRFGFQPGLDIKRPWEFSRMQYLPTLSLTYGLLRGGLLLRLSHEAIVHEYKDAVLDFMADNPPGYGPNWACAMEVGIRVVNCLTAYRLLKAYQAVFDEEFEEILCRSVYEHARHIINNLEYSPDFAGNHYLANITGLLFAAAHLPRSDEVDAWLGFAVQELIAATQAQFLADGLNFEASLCYHRFSAEMVVYGTALTLGLSNEKKAALREYGHRALKITPRLRPSLAPDTEIPGTTDLSPFPPEHWERLRKIAWASAEVFSCFGRIPQIGDNDGGRLLKLIPVQRIGSECPAPTSAWDYSEPGAPRDEEDHLDASPLLDAFAGLLQPPAGSHEAPDTQVVRFLARGAHANIPLSSPGGNRRSKAGDPQPAVIFPDFGVFILENRGLHLIIRLGPVGQNGRGGHAHNDQLSFELWCHGAPVLVDPGTYCYTSFPEKRNLFRSTAMHNTVTLEGKEQNPLEQGLSGLFRLTDTVQPQLVEVTATTFLGKINGAGPEITRSLRLEDNLLIGEDVCRASGEKAVHFHFAPGLSVEPSKGGLRVSANRPICELRAETGLWGVTDTFYSPTYGEIMDAKAAALRSTNDELRWSIEFGGK